MAISNLTGYFIVAAAALTSAILGAILAFCLSIWRDSINERRTTQALRKHLASGLLAESVALRDRFLEVYTRPLQDWQPGRPLHFGGVVEVTNLFAVYDGNTDKLGLFEHEHSKAIVRAYTLAKAQVESISSIAEVTQRYLYQIAGYVVTENPIGKGLQAQLQSRDDRVGPKLQKEATDVYHAWADAINVLEKYAAVKSG